MLRVVQPEHPDARACRARCGRIVEGVARQAVAGRRVEPQDLARQRIDELRAERADVLGRRHQPVGEGLLIVGLGLAAHVVGTGARAVAAGREQRAVAAEGEPARPVSGIRHQAAGRRCAACRRLAYEHAPTRVVDLRRTVEVTVPGRPHELVADEAPDGGATRRMLTRPKRCPADRDAGAW